MTNRVKATIQVKLKDLPKGKQFHFIYKSHELWVITETERNKLIKVERVGMGGADREAYWEEADRHVYPVK